MATTTIFDLDSLRAAIERDGIEAIANVLAEDSERISIDQATPPASPATLRGRDAARQALRGIAERGITTRLRDGFVAGNRVALSIECSYPTGEQVIENAICELRDGEIVRWHGVQAWDE